MHVHLAAPGELRPAEITAWQSMQRATTSLANPFLSPEFALAVGRFRPAARVAVLTDGASTTGFFPFERGRLGAGAPLLSWPGTLWQGLVHAPGADWDPQELLRKCQLSVWQFDHLVAGQGPFVPYQAGLAASPVIDLTGGFAAYHAKLQAKAPRFCRDIARRVRNLARDVGPVRFEADARDVTLLHTLMTWKSEQYRQMGVIDRFGRAWFAGLLEALLATRSGHVSGLLSATYAGDQPVAAQFGLRCGDALAGWFTAYDPQFARHSPGMIQFMQMAEHCAAGGVRTIDLGEGAAGYKERLKSHDGYVAHGMVTSRSVLAAAHRARSVSAGCAARAVLRSPRLYRATRQVRSVLR